MSNSKKTADIIKIAALFINEEGRLLIVKPKGKDTWISLGGKIEEGETEVECLKREIKEELNVDSKVNAEVYVKTPIEPAANKENITVQITFYLAEIFGEIRPDGEEIEDYRWISKTDFDEIRRGKSIVIGTGLLNYAVPKLIKDALLK